MEKNQLSGTLMGKYISGLWLYYGLFSLLPVAIGWILSQSLPVLSGISENFLSFVGMLNALGLSSASLFLWRNKILIIRKIDDFTGKMHSYRQAYLQFLMIIMLASLLNAVLYCLSMNTANLYLGLATVLLSLSRFPGKNSISNTLQLGGKEDAKLMNNSYIFE